MLKKPDIARKINNVISPAFDLLIRFFFLLKAPLGLIGRKYTEKTVKAN